MLIIYILIKNYNRHWSRSGYGYHIQNPKYRRNQSRPSRKSLPRCLASPIVNRSRNHRCDRNHCSSNWHPMFDRETFKERSWGNHSHKQDEAFALCFCHCTGQMGKVRKKLVSESIHEEAISPICRYLTHLFRKPIKKTAANGCWGKRRLCTKQMYETTNPPSGVKCRRWIRIVYTQEINCGFKG